MKGAIVYKTKYGTTKQYAEWLGVEFNMPVIKCDDLSEDELKRYDFLLIGTPVYIGKFQIARWLKCNIKNLIAKKIFLFIVAGTSGGETEAISKIVRENVPQKIKSYCEIYFLKGKVAHKTLSFTDKLLLKFAATFEKNPVRKRVYIEDVDGVKRENLLPLINAIRIYTAETIVS